MPELSPAARELLDNLRRAKLAELKAWQRYLTALDRNGVSSPIDESNKGPRATSAPPR